MAAASADAAAASAEEAAASAEAAAASAAGATASASFLAQAVINARAAIEAASATFNFM